MTTALVTGVTGQDGRYLSELLLEKGYRVVGVARHAPQEPLPGGTDLRRFDVGSASEVRALLRATRPREIYHLAAETSVARSWDDPEAAKRSAQGGAATLLDAVRLEVPDARVFVASSSEVFSASTVAPQDEGTPLAPGSPYGLGKAEVITLARIYRADFGLHASVGILYNHESPRRPPRFVSRKVSSAAAAISLRRGGELRLGNIEARRDWGFAGDYVDAMWRMLQRDAPDDFVIGTGQPRTVADLCEAAFARVGLDYRDHVVSDPALFRPTDAASMVANAAKARRALGWMPQKPFSAMIEEMVDADIARLRHGEA